MVNTTDDRTLCCSDSCKERFKCKRSYINNSGTHYVEDYSSFGTATYTDNGCEVEHWCGEQGDYKMFEPINRVSKETLQELEDILTKLGIAVRDENGNDRLSGDILNDVKEKIRKDFGT